MNEDNMNLNELEELRESYHLMDEKLDGQEIVTPEQIRVVIEKKVTLLKSGLMHFLIWIYVIGFPLITVVIHFTSGLSNLALWIVGIYTLVGIGINVFLLCKVSRKDFVELDLSTLMHREKRYRRIYLSLLVITYVFWLVFAFVFVSITYGIILIVFLLLLDIPRFYQKLVQSFKTGLQEKYETTPTLLGRIGKIVLIAVIILCLVILVAILTLYIIAFFKT
jgi:hypothetical protein